MVFLCESKIKFDTHRCLMSVFGVHLIGALSAENHGKLVSKDKKLEQPHPGFVCPWSTDIILVWSVPSLSFDTM